MDENSSLISIDNDSHFQKIADSFLGDDKRLRLVCTDGGQWLETNSSEKFDYIFADTWHGKFLVLEPTLEMLNRGGIYIIDDMIQQAHWPQGHVEKVDALIDILEKRKDLTLTKMMWATGLIIAVRK
jgi:predicted O-methyltransferase YrrM